MKTMWILVFAAIALSATCVSGHDCNNTLVRPCFDDIAAYEAFAFPLFGEDEAELDEICRKINDSNDCIHNYVDECKGHPECDKDCKETIMYIEAFSNSTGLYKLQANLCNPDSSLRKHYLENYVCLEDNREKFATCHNYSQNSQSYIHSIEDVKERIPAQCCYFSWYTSCFKNATETCREDASNYVSFGLYTLIGHVKENFCKESTIQCEMPPTEDQHYNEPSPPEDGMDEVKTEKPDIQVAKAKKSHSNNASHFFASTYHRVILLISMISTKYLFSIN